MESSRVRSMARSWSSARRDSTYWEAGESIGVGNGQLAMGNGEETNGRGPNGTLEAVAIEGAAASDWRALECYALLGGTGKLLRLLALRECVGGGDFGMRGGAGWRAFGGHARV